MKTIHGGIAMVAALVALTMFYGHAASQAASPGGGEIGPIPGAGFAFDYSTALAQAEANEQKAADAEAAKACPNGYTLTKNPDKRIKTQDIDGVYKVTEFSVYRYVCK